MFVLSSARRTSTLEEKSTACSMLCCYADELKDGFFPYVKEVSRVAVMQTASPVHRYGRAREHVCPRV